MGLIYLGPEGTLVLNYISETDATYLTTGDPILVSSNTLLHIDKRVFIRICNTKYKCFQYCHRWKLFLM